MLKANEHPELHKHLKEKIHVKTIALRLLVAACVIVTIVLFGRYLGTEIKMMETRIAGLGVWSPIVFIIIVIILTSMFVPDTLLAVAAGVLFGLFWGTFLIVIGAIITATINYLVARKLFRVRIEKILRRRPKFLAIHQLAEQDCLRLQLLLRLSPINPVLVSYILGAAGVRYLTFLLATTGLIPTLFVEVYFGHLTSHVTKIAGNVSNYSIMHTVVTAVGFVVSIAVIIFIVRATTSALAKESKNLLA
jgi:uncharacterized membrane protein YdjX (TVP38/TMEM64 family)